MGLKVPALPLASKLLEETLPGHHQIYPGHTRWGGLVDIRKEVDIGTECSQPTLNKGPYEFGWYSPASWAREVAQAS